ncbi:MAG: BsuPI-related putative proteinase inhibitor [candidate division KSB1 bacterium]|nr:BsuPI-related putative proteinase inhibitor [candidate division KSB1 bacterium]MDZ7275032.1 BsuPI-related putative proteinase inhibitor [candidate division KSB1 bacterium]MDZ7286519.1 BsuPI-related putative proteinase inhibitor [candidate division KSB1 bacterium]MDZ7299317.1 BsuPI-related putative proteinase inhibitor [candidate division KSB1 bacterium]MDZ7306988.1 BsuPI-related putative proteinase inhibitor [candidate division KSB1 bacterium]
MSNRITQFTLLLAALALLSCKRANLFEANDNQNAEAVPRAEGEATIALHLTGGFAGVQQQLFIYANGHIRHVDVQNGQSEITGRLDPEQYGELIALFLQSDFLHLGDRYLQNDAADAFVYEILFNYAGHRKRIVTDNLAAPAGLQAIIARLSELLRELAANALTLELAMDRTELRHGESVRLTLTASNQTSHPLRLQTGGQKYDFFAYPVAALNPVSPSWPQRAAPVWNWAADKAFIALVEEVVLAPGEKLQYRTVWEGRANSGALLEGTYYVGARLTALPGGTTALHELKIVKH